MSDETFVSGRRLGRLEVSTTKVGCFSVEPPILTRDAGRSCVTRVEIDVDAGELPRATVRLIPSEVLVHLDNVHLQLTVGDDPGDEVAEIVLRDGRRVSFR